MKTKYTISLLVTVMVAACGDESTPLNGTGSNPTNSTPIDVSRISGSFTFSKIVCNGTRLSISDYKETLTVSAGRGSIETITPECTATETFRYEPEGTSLFLSNDNISCESVVEDRCDFIFKINGLPTHYVCPASFPFAIGYWNVSGTENNIQVARPDGCTAYYTRK